ncbi:hypothetical protein [Fimbriiglobus ruber]|uniref:Uncharacterized protein n=1 Tax=Fimbriiglobus ruber TaxID=1908690 RepID=A0A225DWN2_9BACT|nr:hypothetical protein [Fimbriiglobus ruber]OWK45761.1 hypothetical protein FRUB_02092 [Fimbriiglobus ruber]
MATLTYNGITLSYCSVRSVDHKPVPDPSGTDQLYTSTEIHVTGYLNGTAPPAQLTDDETYETPVQTWLRIRHLLLLPRRQLIFTQDGANGVRTFITNDDSGDGDLPPDVDASGAVYLDDANGPQPLYARVVSPLTNATYAIDFAVKITLVECDNPNYDEDTGSLSLRWSETTDYDESSWLCTKTRTGVLMVSSLAALDVDSDAVRRLVTPVIPAGFRRASAKYIVDTNGLAYRFTFVDKQLMKLPHVATKIRGSMSVEAPMTGGMRLGSIHLTLSGQKGLPTIELLNAGIRIAVARILATNPQRTGSPSTGPVMYGHTVTESLDDDKNEITLDVHWKCGVGAARTTGSSVAVAGAAVAGSPLLALAPNFAVVGSLVGEYQAYVAANAPAAEPPPALPGTYAWVGQPYAGIDPASAAGKAAIAASVVMPTRGVAATVQLVAAVLNDPCGQRPQPPPAPPPASPPPPSGP